MIEYKGSPFGKIFGYKGSAIVDSTNDNKLNEHEIGLKVLKVAMNNGLYIKKSNVDHHGPYEIEEADPLSLSDVPIYYLRIPETRTYSFELGDKNKKIATVKVLKIGDKYAISVYSNDLKTFFDLSKELGLKSKTLLPYSVGVKTNYEITDSAIRRIVNNLKDSMDVVYEQGERAKPQEYVIGSGLQGKGDIVSHPATIRVKKGEDYATIIIPIDNNNIGKYEPDITIKSKNPSFIAELLKHFE